MRLFNRVAPVLLLVSSFGLGCTTSDVAWDETQYSKSQSIKQMVGYLQYPLDRKIVLAKLGSPAFRYAERSPITALIPAEEVKLLSSTLAAESKLKPGAAEEFQSAIFERLSQSKIEIECFGYQTGPVQRQLDLRQRRQLDLRVESPGSLMS
ncbi:MAG: hypothetical protein WC538_23755 [Thermoanaerobaculia bacterium]|jgi:hypothetical protein